MSKPVIATAPAQSQLGGALAACGVVVAAGGSGAARAGHSRPRRRRAALRWAPPGLAQDELDAAAVLSRLEAQLIKLAARLPATLAANVSG